MRIFIKIALSTYIIAGLAFLLGPAHWFPASYHTNAMGTLALISAFIILLPWIVFPKNRNNKYFIRFQFLVTVGLVINAAGGLGLYRIGFEYDKITHFVTPLLLTFAFFYVFTHVRRFGDKKALVLSAMFVLFLSLFWEILENVANLIFIEEVFVLGGGGSLIRDTVLDTVADILGIGVAYFMLNKKINEKDADN